MRTRGEWSAWTQHGVFTGFSASPSRSWGDVDSLTTSDRGRFKVLSFSLFVLNFVFFPPG